MLSTNELLEIIRIGHLLEENVLQQAILEAEKDKKSLLQYIVSVNLLSEETIYKGASSYFKVPYISLKNKLILSDVLNIIPESIANIYQMVVIEVDDKNLHVATTEPYNLEIIEFLTKKTGLNIVISLTSPTDLANTIRQYRHNLAETEFKQFVAVDDEDLSKTDIGSKMKAVASDVSIVKLVDTILEYAITGDASDIHIEPEEQKIGVRYRIDGILRNVMNLPKSIQASMISRIKIMSNLKLDEHRIPQDGRLRVETPKYKISVRVSLIPVLYGEKIVMRLLNEASEFLSLDVLGFQKDVFEIINKAIKKPHGMILTTGPTGSGKTTSLYSMLGALNTPSVNITTIEDPIEYKMAHINQSQVSTRVNYTFATGLRAFLRQDPNIIMVGEIRDEETASIAINAALTGHLVLSTLHTNDAVTTMPRLIDMGIPPFLVASTVNVIIAQRLVRKICQDCKTSYTTSIKELDGIPSFTSKNILDYWSGKHPGETNPLTDENGIITAWRGVGCSECHNGYKGRIGIYEVIEMNPKFTKLILNKASTNELTDAMKEDNILTMAQDGCIKILEGITTIEEVLRTTRENVM